jgi:hypothetical protein
MKKPPAPSNTVNGCAQLQIATTAGGKESGFMLLANRP